MPAEAFPFLRVRDSGRKTYKISAIFGMVGRTRVARERSCGRVRVTSPRPLATPLRSAARGIGCEIVRVTAG